MIKPPFIEKFDSVGNWDITKLIDDLKNLVTATGCDWDAWSRYNKITTTKFKDDPIYQQSGSGNINITCNLGLSATLEEQLWNYSGRRYQESIQVDHSDLHTLNPVLHGTYTEKLYKKLVEKLGPIYMRIHNKEEHGLYWHKDISYAYPLGNFRYHIALWTNPGHFIVWTDDDMPWEKGVQKEHATTPYSINSVYLPVTGDCYKLATGHYVHGVSSIGIGFNPSTEIESRCHVVIVPIIPYNRHSTYIPLR
jgi:hypothetical protein